jgi:hypothetical protein
VIKHSPIVPPQPRDSVPNPQLSAFDGPNEESKEPEERFQHVYARRKGNAARNQAELTQANVIFNHSSDDDQGRMS